MSEQVINSLAEIYWGLFGIYGYVPSVEEIAEHYTQRYGENINTLDIFHFCGDNGMSVTFLGKLCFSAQGEIDTHLEGKLYLSAPI